MNGNPEGIELIQTFRDNPLLTPPTARSASSVAAVGRASAVRPSAVQDPLASSPSVKLESVARDVLVWASRARTELAGMVRECASAMVAAVEARDPFTRHHSETVSRYAVELGTRVGLSERQIEVLRCAAMLHDVGKIGVPDHILRKPGPLTDAEFEVVKTHPSIAVDILSKVSGLSRSLPLILHHHERFDGGGYPTGLSGNRIPFGARILAVADAVDAMLSRRSYKKPYTRARVIQELHAGSGRQFDPIVARAAIEWLDGDDLHLP